VEGRPSPGGAGQLHPDGLVRGVGVDVVEPRRRADGADGPASAPPGSAAVREETTPLVISSLAPDPVPVEGTDGRYHVAYELAVLDAAPKAAGITVTHRSS
jgi:hypothetical protein